MNYELALKLEQAGFPSDAKVGWKVPNLSELIEACGDEFYSLQKDSDGWVAMAKSEWIVNQNASTPEEAVANLYLAINSK